MLDVNAIIKTMLQDSQENTKKINSNPEVKNENNHLTEAILELTKKINPQQAEPKQELTETPETNQSGAIKAEAVVSGTLPYNESEALRTKIERDKTKTGLLGFNLNKFKELETRIDGLQTGLYLVGGRENAGKTAFILNLFLDTLQSSNDTYCLFYSLDDNVNIIRNRILAILSEKLSINQVAKPNQLTDNKNKGRWETPEDEKSPQTTQKNYYDRAVNEYLKLAPRFNIVGSEDIENTGILERDLTNLKQKGKVAVFVDAVYNLELENEQGYGRELNIKRANKLKEIVKKYDIPLIGTVEIRKESNGKDMRAGEDYKAPTTSDIMESGKYAYNADLIWMLWYDRENKKKIDENSKEDIYINISYAKNKLSDYRSKHIAKFIRKSSIYNLDDKYKGEAETEKKSNLF